jgi:hypothetical protein
MKPEIRQAMENLQSLKEREMTMYNFFNHNTTDQHEHDHDHEHDHGTPGSAVKPHDHNNSNSESRHDYKELNQHKPEKESKDMYRTIQNTIAPILTGFTVSMMFIFTLAFDATGSERVTFQNDYNRDVIAVNDRRISDWDYDLNARLYTNDQITRFGDRDAVRYDKLNYDSNNDFNGDQNLIGFADGKFVDPIDGDFNRLAVDRNNDGNRFARFSEVNTVPVTERTFDVFGDSDTNISGDGNVSVFSDGDVNIRDNGDINDFTDNQDARFDVGDVNGFNGGNIDRGDSAF